MLHVTVTAEYSEPKNIALPRQHNMPTRWHGKLKVLGFIPGWVTRFTHKLPV